MRNRTLSMFLAAGTTLLLLAAVGCAVESPTVGQVQNDPDRPGSSGCPNGTALKNFLAAGNVAADFTNTGLVTTYRFAAFADEPPVGGVPGLIKYCVYPDPAAPPSTVDALATGANGAPWTSSVGSSSFSFGRPDGNPSNIPLDVPSTTMGTATWDELPSAQTILLHINDPAVCASLYGGDPGTCFVKPGQASACILDHGETNVAYNAIPFGAADCPGSSLGFQATRTNEVGDEVELAGTARRLVSLKVLFASWGCESGNWYAGDCQTNSGATFTHAITANIYAVDDCSGTPCVGTKLATVTQSPIIPYRPSTDPQCAVLNPDDPNPYYYKYGWYNAVAGACKPQISTVLTFDFTSQNVTLPDRVIWSVAYNTSNSGYAPLMADCSAINCAYDALNVGIYTFPGAPYSGTDVDPHAIFVSFREETKGYYCDGGAGGWGFLRFDGDATPGCTWSGNKPLGEIITTP